MGRTISCGFFNHSSAVISSSLIFLLVGMVVHQIEHQFFKDHAQAAGAHFTLQRLVRYGTVQPRRCERHLDSFVLEELRDTASGWRSAVCVRMSMSAASSSSSRIPKTGRRPTNSGIKPYFRRSCGSAWRSNSAVALWRGSECNVRPSFAFHVGRWLGNREPSCQSGVRSPSRGRQTRRRR